MRVSAEDVDAHLAQLVAVLRAQTTPDAAAAPPIPSAETAATSPAAPADSTSTAAAASAASGGSTSDGGSSIVLLHLGVANTATAFRLESRAYNCATFRVPDANGWSPQWQELEPGMPGGLEGWVGSALPLEAMAEALAAKGHGDVVVSTDAGRFICNWCYYRSCRHVMQIERQQQQQQPAPSAVAAPPSGGGSGAAGGTDASSHAAAGTAAGVAAASAGYSAGISSELSAGGNGAGGRCRQRWHSLFIHVPPFSVYDETAQRAFLIDAIREVAARVAAYDDGLDAHERHQPWTSGSGAAAGAAESAAAAAADAVPAADGGGSDWRPSVVQGTGLPEPSPAEQALMAAGAVATAVVAVEDASAGGGDGVGLGLGLMTHRS
ncbi:hypothetical protein HXX76_015327 [Chlamydomonas incerta]|uniref:Uncharacterized protein n=1 Tax=Chlamydomonas incerta TaxID=51695 RepID=A0A835SA09_CHLIN|nr:hypothetical protein HXX76_015327 [Chlamydomonas incerta]|eukprot:KAG2423457.1 hypothetical protein HXX76_015327 [Chlamydomonas incerta]